MLSPLRLLVLLPTSPLPIFSGGRQRMHQLLRRLCQSHELTVLSFWRDEEAREGLAQLGRELPIEVVPVPFARLRGGRVLPAALWRRWRGWRAGLPADIPIWDQPGMRRALAQTLAQKSFDLMQVEWPYLAPYALAHPHLPSVLITHDIFSIAFARRARLAQSRLARQRLLREARAWERYERFIYARLSAVAAMSEVDAQLIRQRAASAKVVVLPNGVDAEALTPAPVRAQVRRLLFVGSPTHPPNIDAACWLLSDIWPPLRQRFPFLQLTLVNLDHPRVCAYRQPGVEITGRLPDLTPVYQKADLALAPLRAGSGTRLKILEAFALGVPVISTTLGYEGLDVTPGIHLFSADTPTEFIATVARLLDDQATRAGVAEKARRLAAERYDWRVIATQHEALYRALLDAHRPPTSIHTLKGQP